jgi:hypothetical protein
MNCQGQPNFASASTAANHFRNKGDVYDALLRNQYFVADRKDPLMSGEFMLGVVKGENWLPKTSEISNKNLASKPSKIFIADLLVEKMSALPSQGDQKLDLAIRMTACRILKHPPKKDWMIRMLATVDPDNPVFAKDYVAPKYDYHGNEVGEKLTAMPASFFENLPPSKATKKRTMNLTRGAGASAASDKAEAARQKIARLQAKLDRDHERQKER